jgi:hypothetical protein
MLQVSLIGYAVSGAFLGLAYFNYYYALLAIVVGMQVVLEKELAALGITENAQRESHIIAQQSQPMARLSRPHSLGPSPRNDAEVQPTAKSVEHRKWMPSPRETVALLNAWYRRL